MKRLVKTRKELKRHYNIEMDIEDKDEEYKELNKKIEEEICNFFNF